MRTILLICGAPRTGTSMLVRALDWHPNVLMYPTEVTFLSSIFYGNGDLMDRGRKEFIFADRNRLRRLSESLRTIYGYEGSENILRIDSDKFSGVFSESIQSSVMPHQALRILEGLGEALIRSSEMLSTRYAGRKDVVFAFKLPFFPEALGEGLLRAYENVYLLGSVRGLIERYASAKARRLKEKMEILPLATLDYPTFQLFLHITSNTLLTDLKRNWPKRVFVNNYSANFYGRDLRVYFEELGIGCDPAIERQTLFGCLQHLPSSYGAFDGDANTLKAMQHSGKKALSVSERLYLDCAYRYTSANGFARRTLSAPLKAIGKNRFLSETNQSWLSRQDLLKRMELFPRNGNECASRFLLLLKAHRPALS